MALAGLIAAGVMLAIFVGSGELMARSGALVIDLTAYLLPNASFERDATKILFLISSPHPHFMGAGVFGELERHHIGSVTGLAPVKLDPEKRAASSAGTAWMGHL